MSEPTAAAPTTTDNASVAEDFVDIFTSPSKVFARRAKASPMAPYLVVCLVMIALFFASKNLLAPIFDVQIQKQLAMQMKANPQLTQDMVDKMKPMMAISFNVVGVIGIPLLLLISSLVLWIIGRFFMSTALTFGTALLIVSYSWFPRILSGAVSLVEGMTMDVSKMTSPYQLSISASRLFDPATMSDGLYQVLAQIDLFAIWGYILIVLGLMHAAKFDKSKATTTAIITFICGCIPALFALAKGQ
jgi:hypothetical protein